MGPNFRLEESTVGLKQETVLIEFSERWSPAELEISCVFAQKYADKSNPKVSNTQ